MPTESNSSIRVSTVSCSSVPLADGGQSIVCVFLARTFSHDWSSKVVDSVQREIIVNNETSGG